MNPDYHLTRTDQGGSDEIRVEVGPDGTHVYADKSIPEWVIDARVRAALIPRLIKRYEQAHVDRPTPVDAGLIEMARRACGHATARLLDTDFLGAADKPTIMNAIVEAATTDARADLVDLQTVDPRTGNLEIQAVQGFSAEFVEKFRLVSPDDPTACALALTTGKPVMIDDITRSPIFLGQPSLDPIRGLGSHSVASYPLADRAGGVVGVLSCHYRNSRAGARRVAGYVVARAATVAIQRCPRE